MLPLLLTLVACEPTTEPGDCAPVAGDWIEVPAQVEKSAQGGSGASSEALTLEGEATICAVVCTPWESVGIALHPIDSQAMYEGEWTPADDVGPDVEIPGSVYVYAGPESMPGDVASCEITSTAGVDVIEVVAVE